MSTIAPFPLHFTNLDAAVCHDALFPCLLLCDTDKDRDFGLVPVDIALTLKLSKYAPYRALRCRWLLAADVLYSAKGEWGGDLGHRRSR